VLATNGLRHRSRYALRGESDAASYPRNESLHSLHPIFNHVVSPKIFLKKLTKKSNHRIVGDNSLPTTVTGTQQNLGPPPITDQNGRIFRKWIVEAL
jgi:hypothetical protein